MLCRVKSKVKCRYLYLDFWVSLKGWGVAESGGSVHVTGLDTQQDPGLRSANQEITKTICPELETPVSPIQAGVPPQPAPPHPEPFLNLYIRARSTAWFQVTLTSALWAGRQGLKWIIWRYWILFLLHSLLEDIAYSKFSRVIQLHLKGFCLKDRPKKKGIKKGIGIPSSPPLYFQFELSTSSLKIYFRNAL